MRGQKTRKGGGILKRECGEKSQLNGKRKLNGLETFLRRKRKHSLSTEFYGSNPNNRVGEDNGGVRGEDGA